MPKPQISSVRVCREVDPEPDLSYLGEYSNQDEGHAIDRQARGDCGHNEFCYWNPGANHCPHNPKNWAHVKGRALAEVKKQYGSIEQADAAYVEQDYQRCEAYNRGSWYMVGVWAEAELIVGGVAQTIRSGGLWGIASDSDVPYFCEVANEELGQLKDILRAMGCAKRAVAVACKEAIGNFLLKS